MEFTICKKWDEVWKQYVHHIMRTFSRENLKKKKIFSYFYCRFIDNIFFLWNGTRIQLQEFINKLNNRHSIIKFDFKFSKTSIEFLDIMVYKNKKQNKLLTTVYCKSTDRINFLHYTFAHPRSL